MRRTLLSLVLVATTLSLGGCGIAALVAAGSYASSVNDADRKAFHEHNLEREKAGLAPLTLEEWRQRNGAEPATKPADSSM